MEKLITGGNALPYPLDVAELNSAVVEMQGIMDMNSAGVALLLTAGLGASAAYIKTDNGAKTLLAADADDARVALIIITVTEAFADAGGNQPVVIVGETDTANKFAANPLLVDAAAGSVFVLAGTLTAAKALLVTLTAAVGAGTGAISVSTIVLPAAV